MNTGLGEQRSLGWIGRKGEGAEEKGGGRREEEKEEGKWAEQKEGIIKLERKVKLRVSFTAKPFQFPRE